MSGAFIEFGFGQNDKGIGKKSEKFKGETGRSYRLSFSWWPGMEDGKPDLDAKTPKFVGAKRYYFEGVGYILATDPAMEKIAGSPPRLSIATTVVVWPTNEDGEVDMARVGRLDFKVLPWIFSEDKYKSFTPIHREFHFGGADLTVNCSDSKFQKMTFGPCRTSLLRQMMESDKKTAAKVLAHIIERTQAITARIQSEIGREMSMDKLREKLAGGGGGGGSGNAAAAAGASLNTADIDGLVDDVLE
jgi:hypothetical protein